MLAIHVLNTAASDPDLLVLPELLATFPGEPSPATPPAYAAWAATQGLNSLNSGPARDPDRDGLANLLEFVFGTSPTTPDPHPLDATPHPDGGLRLVFTRRIDPSVTVTLESSTGDGGAWTPATDATTEAVVPGPEPGFATHSVHVPTTTPTRLVRLAVGLQL
jgi:hypothetical protein